MTVQLNYQAVGTSGKLSPIHDSIPLWLLAIILYKKGEIDPNKNVGPEEEKEYDFIKYGLRAGDIYLVDYDFEEMGLHIEIAIEGTYLTEII
jgi:hypothetical protein